MKQVVSNTEFETALANQDNANVIRSVLNSYARQINEDDLHACGVNALWKTLRKHDPNHPSGKKFTSSLWRYCNWECLHWLKTQTLSVGRMQRIDFDKAKDVVSGDVHLEKAKDLVNAALAELGRDDRELLRQHYYEGMTLTQLAVLYHVSRSCARVRLKTARERLRQIILTV